ncbi:thiamine phosphate synthase [Solimonas soli]|uniref:thiamine phosphate synthase n=1 Tax=Solimonas soli TaxID=413479 RepID=UPI000489E92B|nr:thiamine phosphate synthase [Solimonas soli]
MSLAIRGLYAITPERLVREPAALLTAVAAAIGGGAGLIQYRDKWNPPAERERLAAALAALCRARGAAFIVNDDLALAVASGADGVHLGAADGSVRDARLRLGAGAIVGATCGNSLPRARAAIADGASYVAFGRFFASHTKPDAAPAELATLTAARGEFAVPICAIGGLTPDNVRLVQQAGATLFAAVDGVFGADDIGAAARAYVSALEG